MSLDTFVDKIKINKFGGAILLTGTLTLAESYLEIRFPESYETVDIVLTAAKSLCATVILTLAPPLINRQNRRYESLMRKITSNGYDGSYCSKYMDHPCGRSIVKTVLERTDNTHKYTELKKNNPLNIKSFIA